MQMVTSALSEVVEYSHSMNHYLLIGQSGAEVVIQHEPKTCATHDSRPGLEAWLRNTQKFKEFIFSAISGPAATIRKTMFC
jgi:hypothetical protein